MTDDEDSTTAPEAPMEEVEFLRSRLNDKWTRNESIFNRYNHLSEKREELAVELDGIDGALQDAWKELNEWLGQERKKQSRNGRRSRKHGGEINITDNDGSSSGGSDSGHSKKRKRKDRKRKHKKNKRPRDNPNNHNKDWKQKHKSLLWKWMKQHRENPSGITVREHIAGAVLALDRTTYSIQDQRADLDKKYRETVSVIGEICDDSTFPMDAPDGTVWTIVSAQRIDHFLKGKGAIADFKCEICENPVGHVYHMKRLNGDGQTSIDLTVGRNCAGRLMFSTVDELVRREFTGEKRNDVPLQFLNSLTMPVEDKHWIMRQDDIITGVFYDTERNYRWWVLVINKGCVFYSGQRFPDKKVAKARARNPVTVLKKLKDRERKYLENDPGGAVRSWLFIMKQEHLFLLLRRFHRRCLRQGESLPPLGSGLRTDVRHILTAPSSCVP